LGVEAEVDATHAGELDATPAAVVVALVVVVVRVMAVVALPAPTTVAAVGTYPASARAASISSTVRRAVV